MSILLSDLLSGTNLNLNLPIENPEITGICNNSTRVKPGNIFVAIKGYKFDGHDFIDMAIENGASAIVAEQKLSASVPVIQVNDGRIALAELSKVWYQHPTDKMKMIGVTASNGKTTTAFMIDHILSSYFYTTGLIGTVVVRDGKSAVSANLTTPDSQELYQWLGRMRDNNCSHVTMEVSSAGQEQHRVHGISYDIATFNNLSREHIDLHGSFEKYFAEKSKLIRNLPASSVAILNADVPLILGLREQTAASSISYSLKDNPADIQIKDIDLSTGAANFKYVIPRNVSGDHPLPSCNLDVSLKVLGLHNVYNASVAITVAKLCGVPDEEILAALADFTGVERRFQLIYDREFKIIDDHFANAGNIDITLETLGLMKYRKLQLLIAIRGNRGSIVNGENAETVVRWIDKLPLAQMITTDSVEFVDELDTVSDEERTTFHGILDEAGIEYTHIPKLTDAIKAVLTSVQPEDVVLLGGCQGMDHAAHVIIPMVAERHADQEQEDVLKILKDRVAGSS